MENREKIRIELVGFLSTITRAGQSVDNIDDDANLIDAGIIDSLAVVQIILYLEQHHAVNLRDTRFDPNALSSISEILGTIERAGR